MENIFTNTNLEPDLLRAITQAVILVHEEQKEKESIELIDKRTHNVRLTLQNYRKFKAYVKNAVSDIKEADKILNSILSAMNTENQNLKIEAIIQTKERTLVMLAHIEKMLNIYKFMCESSGDPADLRRWSIIYDTYINNTIKQKTDIIADKYFVDRSTVFDDINKACKDLGPLIFGINGQ